MMTARPRTPALLLTAATVLGAGRRLCRRRPAPAGATDRGDTMTSTRTRRITLAAAATFLLAWGSAAASEAGRHAADEPRAAVPVFVLEKGRFTTFDPPGVQANELVDVNSRGEVAGTFIDFDNKNRGFLRDKRGRIATFDFPRASATFVNKINDRGWIIGRAKLGAGVDPADQRAYLRDPRGRFTTIHVPGAVTTQAIGIDDHGRVVGDYLDEDGVYHGYLWKKGRFVTTSIDGPKGTGATVTGINDRGQMVGVYQTRGKPGLRGFLLDDGAYRTFADPRLAFTVPLDINDRGQVVGLVVDELPLPQATEAHGFMLKRGSRNSYTRIDVPGAPATAASGNDDRGRIAGIYLNPNIAGGASHDEELLQNVMPGLVWDEVRRS
jgi:hypothetical protein